jgi:hypothetical protein
MFKVNTTLRLLIFFILIASIICVTSCTKNLTETYVVYENNFEVNQNRFNRVFDIYGVDITNKTFDFNGSKVLGPFNSTGVAFKIKNIPDHNVLEVAYDFYVHDNWVGNVQGAFGIPDLFVVRHDNNPTFMTTFSNHSPLKQAYPQWYTAGENPTFANALNIKLPGRCLWKDSARGSSMYRIVESFGHNQPNFELSLSDALQPYGAICEKSWSIDELKITAHKYF